MSEQKKKTSEAQCSPRGNTVIGDRKIQQKVKTTKSKSSVQQNSENFSVT